MMRSPRAYTVAVRRPDGTLAVQERPYEPELQQRWGKIPFARGIATLVESLSLGYRALDFSASQQLTDEERAEVGDSGGKLAGALSIVLALGLFMATPQFLATKLGAVLGIAPAEGVVQATTTVLAYHALIGGFKLLVFFAYVSALGLTADGKRFFQYHGAEHMTIHAYEQGLPLTVENVRAQTTLHPRCGTTFVVLVIVVGIVLGSLVGALVVPNPVGALGQLSLFVVRVSLLPLVAALSYELQRFTARYCTTGPLRVLLYPGFLFQKITTRRPDEAQLEVAITAMESAAWRDEAGDSRVVADEPLIFPTFAAFSEALPSLRPLR